MLRKHLNRKGMKREQHHTEVTDTDIQNKSLCQVHIWNIDNRCGNT